MKQAALDPSELPPYVCSHHGETESQDSLRSNGYIHRRCKACLKERFDKASWQRERRAQLKIDRTSTPHGRDYKPAAVRPEDLPPYRCRKHGEVEADVRKSRSGRILRRCKVCWYKSDDPVSEENRRKRAEYQSEWGARTKAECYAAYGNACSCCGERNPLFLSIDHINRDGYMHRKTGALGGRTIYSWLRSRGYPKDGFRLLCMNCNTGREKNGGICPHESVNG